MAGGTIWKGSIQFGETNLPVKLHSSVREERIEFHLLHRRDHMKLRQQMVCAYEKKPVPSEEQVKGFEVEEGKYLIVDPDELEQAVPQESRIIEVHEFVRSEQIDPIYLERTYYLEPDPENRDTSHFPAPKMGCVPVFRALVAALGEMGAVGICTWTMRKRSYFGALQVRGNCLRLNTLRYADEIVPIKTLGLRKVHLSEKELEIGEELINHLTAPFQPQKFRNEHQGKLRALIDKKARGEKFPVLRPRQLTPTDSDKLLKALEASLKKVA